jgi:NAD(P)-dependent dehydrogenase (short-subunit alcohol dehydrogenase family)
MENGMGSLKNRVALVTGAARGIGRAIALEMAHREAAVAINYRASKTQAEELAGEITELGCECLVVPGDVAVKEEARRIVKCVLDKWGRVDVLVNNAGITRDKSLRKMADDEWADVINVNLNGTYYCTSAVLPAMIEQKFGRIINITSLVGQAGAFGQANYAASKGGVTAFTKTVALEMAKFNITANAIAPGYTCTEMLQGVPDEILDSIKKKIPLGRLARPEEIAKAAGFLAAEADYMTGQQLSINGGILMA